MRTLLCVGLLLCALSAYVSAVPVEALASSGVVAAAPVDDSLETAETQLREKRHWGYGGWGGGHRRHGGWGGGGWGQRGWGGGGWGGGGWGGGGWGGGSWGGGVWGGRGWGAWRR